ncbi:MAG: thrombospondin type 3 repeat-containing protein, partial [Planctomycetota bacterium]
MKKPTLGTIPLLALAGLLATGPSAEAQSVLPMDVKLTFPDTVLAADVIIPAANPPAFIEVGAKGGHGGGTNLGDWNACISSGGRGANVEARFEVGQGDGLLAPGGYLRVIVGKSGGVGISNDEVDELGHEQTGGGGGGGTAVLYSPTGLEGSWTELVVAGGGGGAWQTGCTNGSGRDGKDASLTGCGLAGDKKKKANKGGAGGCGGWGGGTSNAFPWGAPGGAGASGQGAYHSSIKSGAGVAGDDTYQPGGSGWTHYGSGGGGYGSGAGGWKGGGGGGGYSGGGGGLKAGGGGGGSFAADYAVNSSAAHYWTGENPSAFITTFSVDTGESCEKARVLQFADAPFSTDIIGVVQLYPTSTVLFSCAQGPPGPNMWFEYTNTSNCGKTMKFENSVKPGIFERFATCGGGPIECKAAPGPGQFAEFLVQPEEKVYFRFEALNSAAPGSIATLFVDAYTGIADTDGDGVVDCQDNCLSTFNPDQADTDGDGIGDACDACPGSDDAIDVDGDQIPDGCDD